MLIRFLTGLALGAVALHAVAGTALEEAVNANAMPHMKLGGADVTVHFTRMRYQRSESVAAEMLKLLSSRVDRCVSDYKKAGKAVNPPKSWPDMTVEATNDTYWAANRAIQYQRTYLADVSAKDCSLEEKEMYTAELQSAAGKCTIYLLDGGTRGVCDPGAHAAAAARPASRSTAPVPSMAQVIPGLASADPKFAAALAKAQKSMGGAAAASGQKKSVAGVACDVYPMPGGGSHCSTRAGKMVAPALFTNADINGLMIEAVYPKGHVIKAEQVQFDTKVSAAIFAPQGGSSTQTGKGNQ